MKKSIVLMMMASIFTLFATLGMATEKSSTKFAVGSEAYVCDCGAACPCLTISNNPGKCTCGKDMVKAKVVKKEKGTADFMAEGWEKPRTFKTKGKYACACGPKCPCKTISQSPGKCACGVEMKEVKK